MFSDLAGFTSLSEGLEPEELTTLLNDYLTDMTDIILEEGGTLDKYEGDAVIAFLDEEEVTVGVVRGQVALARALLIDQADVPEGSVLLVIEECFGEELAGKQVDVERRHSPGIAKGERAVRGAEDRVCPVQNVYRTRPAASAHSTDTPKRSPK